LTDSAASSSSPTSSRQISPETVMRKFAKSWLLSELSRARKADV
jgi:hypothetical protein